jgi:hypothetical protein
LMKEAHVGYPRACKIVKSLGGGTMEMDGSWRGIFPFSIIKFNIILFLKIYYFIEFIILKNIK